MSTGPARYDPPRSDFPELGWRHHADDTDIYGAIVGGAANRIASAAPKSHGRRAWERVKTAAESLRDAPRVRGWLSDIQRRAREAVGRLGR